MFSSQLSWRVQTIFLIGTVYAAAAIGETDETVVSARHPRGRSGYVYKSPLDPAEYAAFVLENGIRAIAVDSSRIPQSEDFHQWSPDAAEHRIAIAASIGVGTLVDPVQATGLSHFVNLQVHRLLEGTKGGGCNLQHLFETGERISTLSLEVLTAGEWCGRLGDSETEDGWGAGGLEKVLSAEMERMTQVFRNASSALETADGGGEGEAEVQDGGGGGSTENLPAPAAVTPIPARLMQSAGESSSRFRMHAAYKSLFRYPVSHPGAAGDPGVLRARARRFYEEYFCGQNMAVAVVAPVALGKQRKMLEKHLASLPANNGGKCRSQSFAMTGFWAPLPVLEWPAAAAEDAVPREIAQYVAPRYAFWQRGDEQGRLAAQPRRRRRLDGFFEPLSERVLPMFLNTIGRLRGAEGEDAVGGGAGGTPGGGARDASGGAGGAFGSAGGLRPWWGGGSVGWGGSHRKTEAAAEAAAGGAGETAAVTAAETATETAAETAASTAAAVASLISPASGRAGEAFDDVSGEAPDELSGESHGDFWLSSQPAAGEWGMDGVPADDVARDASEKEAAGLEAAEKAAEAAKPARGRSGTHAHGCREGGGCGGGTAGCAAGATSDNPSGATPHHHRHRPKKHACPDDKEGGSGERHGCSGEVHGCSGEKQSCRCSGEKHGCSGCPTDSACDGDEAAAASAAGEEKQAALPASPAKPSHEGLLRSIGDLAAAVLFSSTTTTTTPAPPPPAFGTLANLFFSAVPEKELFDAGDGGCSGGCARSCHATHGTAAASAATHAAAAPEPGACAADEGEVGEVAEDDSPTDAPSDEATEWPQATEAPEAESPQAAEPPQATEAPEAESPPAEEPPQMPAASASSLPETTLQTGFSTEAEVILTQATAGPPPGTADSEVSADAPAHPAEWAAVAAALSETSAEEQPFPPPDSPAVEAPTLPLSQPAEAPPAPLAPAAAAAVAAAAAPTDGVVATARDHPPVSDAAIWNSVSAAAASPPVIVLGTGETEPASRETRLQLLWPLPPLTAYAREQPGAYFLHMISAMDAGEFGATAAPPPAAGAGAAGAPLSLLRELYKRQWIFAHDFGLRKESLLWTMQLEFTLSGEGRERLDELVDLVFAAVNEIREAGVDAQILENVASMHRQRFLLRTGAAGAAGAAGGAGGADFAACAAGAAGLAASSAGLAAGPAAPLLSRTLLTTRDLSETLLNAESVLSKPSAAVEAEALRLLTADRAVILIQDAAFDRWAGGRRHRSRKNQIVRRGNSSFIQRWHPGGNFAFFVTALDRGRGEYLSRATLSDVNRRRGELAREAGCGGKALEIRLTRPLAVPAFEEVEMGAAARVAVKAALPATATAPAPPAAAAGASVAPENSFRASESTLGSPDRTIGPAEITSKELSVVAVDGAVDGGGAADDQSRSNGCSGGGAAAAATSPPLLLSSSALRDIFHRFPDAPVSVVRAGWRFPASRDPRVNEQYFAGCLLQREIALDLIRAAVLAPFAKMGYSADLQCLPDAFEVILAGPHLRRPLLELAFSVAAALNAVPLQLAGAHTARFARARAAVVRRLARGTAPAPAGAGAGASASARAEALLLDLVRYGARQTPDPAAFLRTVSSPGAQRDFRVLLAKLRKGNAVFFADGLTAAEAREIAHTIFARSGYLLTMRSAGGAERAMRVPLPFNLVLPAGGTDAAALLAFVADGGAGAAAAVWAATADAPGVRFRFSQIGATPAFVLTAVDAAGALPAMRRCEAQIARVADTLAGNFTVPPAAAAGGAAAAAGGGAGALRIKTPWEEMLSGRACLFAKAATGGLHSPAGVQPAAAAANSPSFRCSEGGGGEGGTEGGCSSLAGDEAELQRERIRGAFNSVISSNSRRARIFVETGCRTKDAEGRADEAAEPENRLEKPALQCLTQFASGDYPALERASVYTSEYRRALQHHLAPKNLLADPCASR